MSAVTGTMSAGSDVMQTPLGRSRPGQAAKRQERAVEPADDVVRWPRGLEQLGPACDLVGAVAIAHDRCLEEIQTIAGVLHDAREVRLCLGRGTRQQGDQDAQLAAAQDAEDRRRAHTVSASGAASRAAASE